jgi:IS5 family transposase
MDYAELQQMFESHRTRKVEVLEILERIIPWNEFRILIVGHITPKKTGRKSYNPLCMLRIHIIQLVFGMSDRVVADALYETLMYRKFAGLDLEQEVRLPGRVTIMRFRHFLEKHDLAVRFFDVVVNLLKSKDFFLIKQPS